MRPSHRLFMSGLFVALALLCVAVTKAQGMTTDSTFDHPIVFVTDGGMHYVAPVVTVEDDFPEGCDYYSGNPADPCPRADAEYYIIRCRGLDMIGDPNAVWHVVRDNGDDPNTLCPEGYDTLDP